MSVILEAKLSKLDGVDSTKRRRYQLVYGRLHDFEDYMRRLGVDVALSGHPEPPIPHKDAASWARRRLWTT